MIFFNYFFKLYNKRGDFWGKTIKLQNITKFVNYKYFISESNGSFTNILWEDGYNHTIDISTFEKFDQNTKIYCIYFLNKNYSINFFFFFFRKKDR